MPSASENSDVASAVQVPSTQDTVLPNVAASAFELGPLALAVKAIADTARVAHNAQLEAGRTAQAARVEAIIARKTKEAAAALFASQLKGKSKSHSTVFRLC